MALINENSSNLIPPSNLDRPKSDKRNFNLRFLGWWTVFAPRSQSSGLCWNRLGGFYSFCSTNRQPRWVFMVFFFIFSFVFEFEFQSYCSWFSFLEFYILDVKFEMWNLNCAFECDLTLLFGMILWSCTRVYLRGRCLNHSLSLFSWVLIFIVSF